MLSLGCALLLAWMDKKAEKETQRRNQQDGTGGEVIKMSDVKHFPVNFWMVCVVCIAYYVAIFPFIALGK